MKTKMRKFGAWLMAAALAFAGAGAVQAGEVHVSDAAGLKTAFANATADTTIVLDADITTKDHLSCSKDCVLDLAGHKIVGDYSSEGTFGSGTLINVTGSTSFKLISSTSGGGMSVDGVKSFTGKYNGVAVNLSSTATVTFGEADGSNANFTLYGAYQGMNVSGTVIFNGGSFECGTDGVAVQLQSGCNVVLNGGSISSFKGLDSANISIGVGKALACLTSGGLMQLCDIPAEGLDLSYGQIIICVANGQTYKVKQSSAAENKNQLKICAAENTTATVVLDGLCCNNSDTIVCDSGAGSAIVLELDNASTLTGGIRNVGEGELVIQDENGTAGSIKITASNYCAAIGGNQVLSPVGKNITIKSGTIECESVYGAAIGGGGSSGGNAVNIKILGGTVTAKSERGAAIGGGTDGHAENVIISGGTVVASSDRGKAVGDGFQSSGSTGISISCGTYSPVPTADMIVAGYEVIEKDGKSIIGVKTKENVIITTDTQETNVEVPTEVVKDEEVAQKIAQGTKVEGVMLKATGPDQTKGGVEAVLDMAKEDQAFAAAVAEAAEVSVKVEVKVEPTEYDNTADKGKVAFKLTPKATVTVGEGEGKLEREVPVTNDMIDQNQKIAVSIYTGFKPAVITHDDENGSRIETFEGEEKIAYDEATGVATVLISHFSTVSGFAKAADVPAPKVFVAKIGDTSYEKLQAALNAVTEGQTIELLPGTIEEGEITLPNTIKNVTIKGAADHASILKNTTLAHRTGDKSFDGLTIDGVVFDNGRFMLIDWGAGSIKNLTFTNNIFRNLNDTTSEAAVHLNVNAAGAVSGFTFEDNVIDGCTGGQKSGIYGAVKGNTSIRNNTFNNVAFRPICVQIIDTDGVADNTVVTGNTFSGSPVGRLQIYGTENGTTCAPEGTDGGSFIVNNNIFKDITTQQICCWGINTEKVTADITGNYYDAEDPKMFWNDFNGADSFYLSNSDIAANLPHANNDNFSYYTELAEDGTIKESSKHEIVEKMPVAAVVSADGIQTNEHKTLSAALTAAGEGEKVILLADTAEDVSLNVEQEIILNGHAYTGTVAPVTGYEKVHSEDGKIYLAPEGIDVTIDGGKTVKVRGYTAFPTDVTTLEEKQAYLKAKPEGTNLARWQTFVMGVPETTKLAPQIGAATAGSSKVVIKADFPALNPPARCGMKTAFRLMQAIGTQTGYSQYGADGNNPSFEVDVKEIAAKTFWKIQASFKSTEVEDAAVAD